MKLYANDLSPFGIRLKIAIHAKGLPIEVASPQGGTRTPEYLAINPIGKAPCLVLDDGTAMPESEVIMEYLADIYPEKGLRPPTPELAARGRLLSRIADLYVIGVGQKLFVQMNPETRDAAAVEAAFVEIATGVGYLDTFLPGDRYAVGETLTSADCALAPILLFAELFGQMFDRPSPMDGHPKVAAYWARVRTDPVVAQAITDMRAALKPVLGV